MKCWMKFELRRITKWKDGAVKKTEFERFEWAADKKDRPLVGCRVNTDGQPDDKGNYI